MKTVEWTSDLDVGNCVLNDQHKQLFKYLNDYYEAIATGELKNSKKGILSKLLLYTKKHFHDEENHMLRIKYKDYKNHCHLHQEFIDKVNDWVERSRNNKLLLSVELSNYIKNWLIDHIGVEDQKYKDFKEVCG